MVNKSLCMWLISVGKFEEMESMLKAMLLTVSEEYMCKWYVSPIHHPKQSAQGMNKKVNK